MDEGIFGIGLWVCVGEEVDVRDEVAQFGVVVELVVDG